MTLTYNSKDKKHVLKCKQTVDCHSWNLFLSSALYLGYQKIKGSPFLNNNSHLLLFLFYFQLLSGGFINKMYGIHVKSDTNMDDGLVIRVNTESTVGLGADRQTELG